MKTRLISRVIPLSFAFALLLSSLLAEPAFADDGTPPAEPTPVETSNEVGVPTESAISILPEVDPDVYVNSSELTAVVSENETEAEIEPTTIVEDEFNDLPDAQAAENILVIDSAGEPVALATEEASETLETGDPIWCPATVTVPKPNTSGCTDSFGSLAALFADLEANPKNVDGTIWIQKDYSNTTSATLDGSLIAFSTMRNFRINLKGGWNGCSPTCVGTIDTSHPSVVNHQIEILDWNNDITLSHLLITGVTTAGDALAVETSGKVTVTRVSVNNNDDSGARFDGGKDVIVTTGVFNQNALGDGLSVYSNGTVTLVSVTANENGGAGVIIDNQTAGTVKNVVLTTGSFEFNGNGDAGLVIDSKGAITLKDITSTANGGDGANLDNTSSTAGVSLLGVNVFSENLGSGLVINSKGAITANNLVNDSNSAYGAWLANNSSSSSVAITLTGTNEFKFNGSGIHVVSNGTITLNKVTASNSQTDAGAYLNNSNALFASNVILYGINTFNNNQADGLHVLSSSVVAIYSTTSNWNGQGNANGFGLWIDNTSATSPKNVVLAGTNTFSGNYEDGLLISSEGVISIGALNVQENGGNGASINNSTAAPSSQNVTFAGVINASDNIQSGLSVLSLGTISLFNVTANGNGGFGVKLDNEGATSPKSVTISGANSFSSNDATGLEIETLGAITLNNIFANTNLGKGADIQNNGMGAVGAITINGTSQFSENSMEGLAVASRGNIQIANLSSIGNGEDGVSIGNAETGSTGTVSLGTTLPNWCNSLSENAGTGLEIDSNGAITLRNICADSNGSLAAPGLGAEIDNTSAVNPKAVSIYGSNSFSWNYSGGLSILSHGVITANNLIVSNNVYGYGASFNNSASGVSAPQLISLTGTNQFSSNRGSGLTISTFGAITLSSVSANSNGANGGSGYGASLDNCIFSVSACTQTSSFGISLSGKNDFNSNTVDGLVITSLGTISISNLDADANGGSGAKLSNNYGGARGGITLGTKATFLENGANGLEITTRGPISISNLQASSNDAYGANLSNLNAPIPQPLSLNGLSLFEGNLNYGLQLKSLGVITVSNLNAYGNGGFGILIDNAQAGATGGVNIAGTQLISDNAGNGLEIKSNRPITVNNLTSELNTGFGALLKNDTIGSPYDVKLTGINKLNENGLSGLEVYTLGAITLNSVTANLNGQASTVGDGFGAYLDNKTGASLVKPIVLTNASVFEDNFEDGLYILSLGQITARFITANRNGENGVHLDNTTGSNTAGILLTGANIFQSNGELGLSANSNGVISVSNLHAEGNLGGGVELDNSGSIAQVDIFVTGTNIFNNNGIIGLNSGAGLTADSTGKITLNNVTANGNSSYGAWLDNRYLAGVSTVTITGVNTFSANGGSGLYILAKGDVNLAKVVADDNVGDGVSVVTSKNLSLTCASIISNEGTGLYVFAMSGNVTLTGVFSFGNQVENIHSAALNTVIVRACPMP